jgi:hypothetical protein
VPKQKAPPAPPPEPVPYPASDPRVSTFSDSPGRRFVPLSSPGTTVALYRAALATFLADVASDALVPALTARFSELEGRAPGDGEVTAWRRSLPAIADVLRAPPFARAHVFVELRMPLNGRRCDVLLTGRAEGGQPSAVVVELKQWQQVGRSALPEEVAIGASSRQHPSAQVRDYTQFLAHYHSAFVEAGVALAGCAYLHDMSHPGSIQLLRDPIAFGGLPHDYPLFVKHERAALSAWLAERLAAGDGAEAALAIATGGPRPSEKLLDVVVDTIHGTREWKLLDEQRRAYLMITTAVEQARSTRRKTVVVVKGGPGTGKSVLAVQLLAHAAHKHWRVVHASGSQAFQVNLQARTMTFARDLMRRVYGARFRKDLPVAEMFCTFADVARLGEADVLDLVVADEAHRLWDFRKVKWQGYTKILSETPMIEEVIRASLVSAFFLDDHQAVRAGEIGRASVIEETARRLGVDVVTIDLTLQFRCNGSESYVRWVDGLLGFADANDLAWRRYGGYDLTLETSMPDAVARLHALRLRGQTCRLVAGYCWRWSDPIGSTLPHDVKDPRFDGWSGPWIERTEQSRKPTEHRYFRWATDDSCFEQVGSIYSVQGFEFDHVAVVMGEDLVWRGDRWVANLDKNCDTAFKRDVRGDPEGAREKIRAIYRVLLTRGMRGTSLFVLDAETRAHVASRLVDAVRGGARSA